MIIVPVFHVRKQMLAVFPKDHSWHADEHDLNLDLTPEFLLHKMKIQSHWDKSTGNIKALLLMLVSGLRSRVDYRSNNLEEYGGGLESQDEIEIEGLIL